MRIHITRLWNKLSGAIFRCYTLLVNIRQLLPTRSGMHSLVPTESSFLDRFGREIALYAWLFKGSHCLISEIMLRFCIKVSRFNQAWSRAGRINRFSYTGMEEEHIGDIRNLLVRCPSKVRPSVIHHFICVSHHILAMWVHCKFWHAILWLISKLVIVFFCIYPNVLVRVLLGLVHVHLVSRLWDEVKLTAIIISLSRDGAASVLRLLPQESGMLIITASVWRSE